MSATILPFRNTPEIQTHMRKSKIEIDAHIARSSEIFSRRVDYNLRSTSGMGYEYITRLLEGIFKSVASSTHQYSNVDFILRVEYEVTRLNIFECKKLLKVLNEYLQSSTVGGSKDEYFFIHVRNKVFQRYEGF